MIARESTQLKTRRVLVAGGEENVLCRTTEHCGAVRSFRVALECVPRCHRATVATSWQALKFLEQLSGTISLCGVVTEFQTAYHSSFSVRKLRWVELTKSGSSTLTWQSGPGPPAPGPAGACEGIRGGPGSRSVPWSPSLFDPVLLW
eukprot:764793-Hanusia_phi.AAC.2